MGRDLQEVLEAAEAQGFTVRRTKNGHYFVSRNGQPVTTFSGTPSDHRSFLNALAALRRAGFKRPPKRGGRR
jgi:hypothetical protein